jgi:hypothetical protein
MIALKMTGNSSTRVIEGRDSNGRKFQLSSHSGIVKVPNSSCHDASDGAGFGSGEDSEWVMLMSLNARIVTGQALFQLNPQISSDCIVQKQTRMSLFGMTRRMHFKA